MCSYDLVEVLANQAHDSWSGWMIHLFTKSVLNADGTVTIPAESVQRWKRQLATPYHELTATEKESDRREARKTLKALQTATSEEETA